MTSLLHRARQELRRLWFTGNAPTPRTIQSAAGLERNALIVNPGKDSRSLFGEIFDWMFVPLLVAWPLSIGVTFVTARTLADRPYDAALLERARQVSEQLRITRSTFTVPSALLAVVDFSDLSLRTQVVGPAGEVLIGDPFIPKPDLYDFPTPGDARLRNDVSGEEAVRIAYSYQFLGGDPESPLLLVQVMQSQQGRVELANEIMRSLILPQFLMLPALVLLVWFGLTRGLSPLRRLSDQIRRRDPEDQSPIEQAMVPQEITPLVDAFNETLRRLNHNMEAQKRFVADAAHQIKTPLAALRMQAELAQRQQSGPDLDTTLRHLISGAERATRLVNQMLALARQDALPDAQSLEMVDLVTLARRVTAEWYDRAVQRQADLGFEDQTPVARIRADAIMIQEMLSNLIDNALRYSPRGAIVTVKVLKQEGHILLAVEDNGPGVAANERARVFDRFYRVLGTDIEGSGLGLAIVREIAERHGAQIELADSHPGRMPPGLRVTVTFTG